MGNRRDGVKTLGGWRRFGVSALVTLGAGCSSSSSEPGRSDAGVSASVASSSAASTSGSDATEPLSPSLTRSDRVIDVGGGSITVIDMVPDVAAVGDAVLFLHGAAFTSQTWIENGILSSVAATGHRSAAIDLPGSGSSDEVDLANDEFLVALFGALDLDPATTVIVSPSMSGTFSLPALRHPFFADLAGYVPVAPVGAGSFVDGGPTIDVPALVIWGDGDGEDPRGAADRLADGFREAEVLILADAGHAAYQQQPEAFTNALLTFIDRLEP